MATSITTRNFRFFNARQFEELFREQDETTFIFFSRTLPWPDDQNPPDVIDSSENTSYDIWNNMLSLKKVSTSDVSFAIPRVNWTANTVYNQYRSDANFQANNFYVTTPELHVYKCLNNNSNSFSTVSPSGTGNSSITLSDGYVWKYMYSVSASESIKFLTTSWQPVGVKTSDDGSAQYQVQQSAANGAIETITISNTGSGFLNNEGTVVSANTTAVNLATSAETTTGIYVNSSIYIVSGTGAGQLREITSYDGGNRRAFVNTAFSISPDAASTYYIGPTVRYGGDGRNFQATANLNSFGGISKINIINIGENYSRFTVEAQGNTGSGEMLKGHLSPIGGHGSNSITELNGHNNIMSINILGSESNTFLINNEYRVIGLIANPTLTTNNAVAMGTAYNQTYILNLANTAGTFELDEPVKGLSSNNEAFLVEYINSNTISVINRTGDFSNNESLQGNTSGATAKLTGIRVEPLNKYSGEVLYVTHRSPIERDSAQEEDIKIIIQF